MMTSTCDGLHGHSEPLPRASGSSCSCARSGAGYTPVATAEVAVACSCCPILSLLHCRPRFPCPVGCLGPSIRVCDAVCPKKSSLESAGLLQPGRNPDGRPPELTARAVFLWTESSGFHSGDLCRSLSSCACPGGAP